MNATTRTKKPKELKPPKEPRAPGVYAQLIDKMFFDRYSEGATALDFSRDDIKTNADVLRIKLPDNIGDLPYYYRFRHKLPKKILDTQPAEREWVIQLAGRARYRFRLAKANRIVPNKTLVTIKIPDSTPEIIARYRLDDEQALRNEAHYRDMRALPMFSPISRGSARHSFDPYARLGEQILQYSG